MKIVQAYYTKLRGWNYTTSKTALNSPLVIVFGNRLLMEDDGLMDSLKQEFPYADFVYGSTAGEIVDTMVFENSLSVTAIEFEKSTFAITTANVFDHDKDAEKLGAVLYGKMPQEDLRHVFVLAGGNFINGSALIAGLEKEIGTNVAVTGGLCGDDGRFERTTAGYNESPKEGEAILVGLYGDSLEVTYASFGGFQPFGPKRLATKTNGNLVYEIDGQPALELYKKYLGEKAHQQLESLLSYPLSITEPGKDYAVVRTILNIDTTDGSIILAGNCAQGSHVQLMMASPEGIVRGAIDAAKTASEDRSKKTELALLVSCMGRKAIMGQRIEEEAELIKEILGDTVALAGFYSYGEIAPHYNSMLCELHNQTMTLTLLSE